MVQSDACQSMSRRDQPRSPFSFHSYVCRLHPPCCRYGLCVWSTGVGPTPFTTSLPFAKTPKGRLAVDEFLRLAAPPLDGVRPPGAPGPGPSSPEQVAMTADEEPSGPRGPWHGCEAVEGVYALGDCCANVDAPLPALAQVFADVVRAMCQECVVPIKSDLRSQMECVVFHQYDDRWRSSRAGTLLGCSTKRPRGVVPTRPPLLPTGTWGRWPPWGERRRCWNWVRRGASLACAGLRAGWRGGRPT